MARKLSLMVLLAFVGLGISGCYVGFEDWDDGGGHHHRDHWRERDGGSYYHR